MMKKFILTLTTLCVLIFTACDNTEDITPLNDDQQKELVQEETPTQNYTLASTESITTDHELMTKFRASNDFQILDASQLNWDEVVLATYQDTDMKAIAIPYLLPSSKVLYAPYHNGEFKAIVMEVTSSVALDTPDQAFTGNLNFYKLDGTKIISASYADDQFVDIQSFGTERGSWWNCFGSCLWNAYPSSPWWIQLACGAALGGCAFGANPAACITLSVCLGGFAGWCSVACG